MEPGNNNLSNEQKPITPSTIADSDPNQRESIVCDNVASKTESLTNSDFSSTPVHKPEFSDGQLNNICSTSDRDTDIEMDVSSSNSSRVNVDELRIENIELKEDVGSTAKPDTVEVNSQVNSTINLTSSTSQDNEVSNDQISSQETVSSNHEREVEQVKDIEADTTCDYPQNPRNVPNLTQNEICDNLHSSETLSVKEKTENVAAISDGSTSMKDESTTSDKTISTDLGTVNGCESTDLGLDSIAIMDTKAGEDSDTSTVESRNMFNTIQPAIHSSADSESDSSSSDESSSSESSENNVKKNNDTTRLKDKQKHGETLVRGEMSLDDLPPIEELSISVSREECEAVGRVYSIVKQLVVVESLPNTPALNLDTVLFRESGNPLGEIFDVFGPVKGPFYCVRFNKHDDIVEKGIEKGELIYCAPQSDYTHYVFTYRLMMEKGSDASWQHDVEVPEELQDYSDDEAERVAKRPGTMAVGDESNENGANRKRRHSSNRCNNNFTMGEEWYRARIDERRRLGVPSSQPRLPVFSPVTAYRPSTPSPFSARRAPRPSAPFSSPISQPPSPSSLPSRPSFTSPPGPPPTPLGPRLAMISPQPPPSMSGPFSKPPSFGPPFVPTVTGTYPPNMRPPTNHSFGSQNPFNFPPIPPMPSDIVPPMFSIPPPRIGCPPRPNILSLPPRQPPPPRPPAFSRHSQYGMY